MAKRAKVKKGAAKKAAKKATKKVVKKSGKRLINPAKPLDHDEPIVVDNGPIVITNGEVLVTLKSNGKKAERLCSSFDKLTVAKKDMQGMSLPVEEFRLNANGSVNFHLFDPRTRKRDKIKVNRFGFDSARLESNIDLFEFADPQTKRTLKMKANAMARLTVIDADGTDGPIIVVLVDAMNNFLFSSVVATIWPVKH